MVRRSQIAVVVGHGQLLKALNALADCTDQRFRIAAVYLAHASPPDLSSFPKTTTIAGLVGCTKRSVELCRHWLEDQGAITVIRGGGRGRSTVIDFSPLADLVNSERRFAVSQRQRHETANSGAQSANGGAETANPPSHVYEKDPSSRTHIKDGADARAPEGERAAPKTVSAMPESLRMKHASPHRRRREGGA